MSAFGWKKVFPSQASDISREGNAVSPKEVQASVAWSAPPHAKRKLAYINERMEHDEHNVTLRLASHSCHGVPMSEPKRRDFSKPEHGAAPPRAIWSNMQQLPRMPSLVYVGFTLRRQPEYLSWGLAISLFDKSLLGVGHVQQDLFQKFSKFAWATASLPSATLLTAVAESHFQSVLESYPLYPSTAMNLLPGDMIVSLNGRLISSFGGSLLAVSNYLKQVQQLSIVAIRRNAAIQELPIQAGNNTGDMQCAAYGVSEVAFRSIQTHLFNDPYLFHFRSLVLGHAGNFSSAHMPAPMSECSYQNKVHSKTGHGGVSCDTPSRVLPRDGLSGNDATPFFQRCCNPLFRDKHGKPIPYDDNCFFDPEDGTNVHAFLVNITSDNFPQWLSQRKATWRQSWRPYCLLQDTSMECCEGDDSPPSISPDFWTQQGHPTLEHWLKASTDKWKRDYSWNQEKRKRLEREYESIVHFPQEYSMDAEIELKKWLQVRKNQWRIMRRKRQRQLAEDGTTDAQLMIKGCDCERDQVATVTSDDSDAKSPQKRDSFTIPDAQASPRPAMVPRKISGDMILIDALLEEQESRQKIFEERPPLDISFLFDATLGAPDDVIAHCLKFLHRSEHGKLLCISFSTSIAMKERDDMWRQMCPSHWLLPRRPRKRWHDLYIARIRTEEEDARQRSDDLLSKAKTILFKGDHLLKIEKLLEDAQRRYGFDINYVSGVICERNSILNLAVIYGRHKVVRWLVEVKGADLESFDRAQFTPLLNAAWAGDRYLVRYLMSKGCDRTTKGTCHYTQPLAPTDFEGLNAEGWARKRGHHELADLIRLGL